MSRDDPVFDESECPFCGALLDSKKIYADCDDVEVYCPECGYVEGVE